MHHLPGKFVWFEHVSGDVARARAFYKALFGWQVERTPAGYETIHNGEENVGGMSLAKPGQPPGWACYLSVADVDAAYAQAMMEGATARVPPTDFVPAGRGASVADPIGAVVWLWRGAQSDRPDAPSWASIGDWCWVELSTPDASRALDFYKKLLGATHERSDRGPAAAYFLLACGGRLRAGIVERRDAGAAARWVPYVRVRDCDACVDTARTLGAAGVVVEPSDIEGIGRFAVISDPLGAWVGVLQFG